MFRHEAEVLRTRRMKPAKGHVLQVVEVVLSRSMVTSLVMVIQCQRRRPVYHFDPFVADLEDAGQPLGRVPRPDDLPDGLQQHGVAFVQLGLHAADVLEREPLLGAGRNVAAGFAVQVVFLGFEEFGVIDVNDVSQGKDPDLSGSKIRPYNEQCSRLRL